MLEDSTCYDTPILPIEVELSPYGESIYPAWKTFT